MTGRILNERSSLKKRVERDSIQEDERVHLHPAHALGALSEKRSTKEEVSSSKRIIIATFH